MSKSDEVKILCHTCEGAKTITETIYETRVEIKLPCPECNGNGYIWVNKKTGFYFQKNI